MIFKPYYYFETGCVAYLFGCGGPALAKKVGAPYCLHESADVALPFEPRWNPLLSSSRDELVEALSDVPPKPAAMEQILRANQGRQEAER